MRNPCGFQTQLQTAVDKAEREVALDEAYSGTASPVFCAQRKERRDVLREIKALFDRCS